MYLLHIEERYSPDDNVRGVRTSPHMFAFSFVNAKKITRIMIMEKQMIINPNLTPPVLHFDDVKERMVKWRDRQTEGCWAKYRDDAEALIQKNEHQNYYLTELARVINQHNRSCLPDERWTIHDWYHRWIECTDGKYFLTVAMIRKGDSNCTRTFLGETPSLPPAPP